MPEPSPLAIISVYEAPHCFEKPSKTSILFCAINEMDAAKIALDVLVLPDHKNALFQILA